MTAQERYRVGLLKWGDALALQEEYCLAQEKYELSFMLLVDESVAPAATAIYEACEESKRPEETEAPPATVTPTPTITLGTPSGTEVTPTTAGPTEEAPAPTETPVPEEGT
jgi:hypothetical protein